MQRAVPLLAALIGLGLCALSFWNAEVQRTADTVSAAGAPPAHVMHGWSHS